MNGAGATQPICPCDGAAAPTITNPPGLSVIAYRNGMFQDFRRALLTPRPSETALNLWRPGANADPAVADLGVMMVEWWAYIADILTFYNERIANEDYLRTAQLPETPDRLVAVLGYRPAPAIGATGVLAALITPGQTATLPKGLQFQSKPGPGQQPQIFELDQDVAIGAPDVVTANPSPSALVAQTGSEFIWPWGGAGFLPRPTIQRFFGETLSGQASIVSSLSLDATQSTQAPIAQHTKRALARTVVARSASVSFTASGLSLNLSRDGLTGIGIDPGFTPIVSANVAIYQLLLSGAVTSLATGTYLLLGARDDSEQPTLIALNAPPAVQTVTGGKQTALSFTIPGTDQGVTSLTAENARLSRSNQNAAPWSINGELPIDSNGNLHLAGLTRQIRPGDWVVLATSDGASLFQVSGATDVLGDASNNHGASSTTVSNAVSGSPPPIPVLHSALALEPTIDNDFTSQWSSVSVLFGWVEVGALIDQPPSAWDGTNANLAAVGAGVFPNAVGLQVLIQDSVGAGVAATASSGGGSTTTVGFPSSTPTPLSPPMQPPLQAYYNLLPVSQGQTIANEVLGSGDAAQAGQSFKLQKSPVTYLNRGSGPESTITISVNGLPWTEAASFYKAQPTDQVFVTWQDDAGATHVDFGDGVNGARLPTGVNNVVAAYRIGAGAASPPAGKLTTIAKAWPGLRAIVNPVAVSGGADAQAGLSLQTYAPRSVLAFNRAVSIADYQALAAAVPNVTRALAIWSWRADKLRAGVTVYVGGSGDVVTPTAAALTSQGDPNRPVWVEPATPVTAALLLTLMITPGIDAAHLTTNVTTALADPDTGLFSPANLGIGQSLFDSRIEAACLAVAGVVAIAAATFYVNSVPDPGPLHDPGPEAFFSLDPASVFVSTQPAAGG